MDSTALIVRRGVQHLPEPPRWKRATGWPDDCTELWTHQSPHGAGRVQPLSLLRIPTSKGLTSFCWELEKIKPLAVVGKSQRNGVCQHYPDIAIAPAAGSAGELAVWKHSGDLSLEGDTIRVGAEQQKMYKHSVCHISIPSELG